MKGDVNTLSLAARFISTPCLSVPQDAELHVASWLDQVAPEDREAIHELFSRFPKAEIILQSIAESSPYLFDIMRADTGAFSSEVDTGSREENATKQKDGAPLQFNWDGKGSSRVLRLLRCDPDDYLATLITTTVSAVASADHEADVMRLLRQTKSEAALLIALCDIGGIWPVMRVTRAMTDIACMSVQCALRYLLKQEAKRGHLQPVHGDRADEGCGLVVLAMGKMGADELNYSSDIDLIVFFDSNLSTLLPDIEPQPFFVRVTQAMVRILQQRTADGYVFRVDLRLRPDPASTPIAISTAAALDYYEREGRTWERAAMIKARPCAGDLTAGETLLAEIAPFVWRKHLDFAALADVHDMKRQMQAFKGHGKIAVEGHNIKIGRGGIREIEFFAQTQQLIAGGRNPELRVRQTLDALNILAANNWITVEARDQLTAAYEFLRRVEHRLQMIADEQVHTLPESVADIERFARFLGYENRDLFSKDLLAHLDHVQGHYSKLFEGDPMGAVQSPSIDYGAGADDVRLLDDLVTLGFRKPKMVAGILQVWLKGEVRALKVEATRQAFQNFIPLLIRGLAKSEDPDAAVVSFDRFLQALQRGSRLIALLSQHDDLVALVALILGAAPRLGDMLVRQPQMMDGLIDPRFFGVMPNQRVISERLAATLRDANSYEEFLDRLRLFGQESLFLIGARILSGTISAQHAGTAFADVAEGIVRTVHDFITQQFATQYGRIKGQETAILAMGKLGSREMTASSDLDLILIYDFDSEYPDSDGKRSLQGAQYFARFTQRLISAFTTRTNFGVLYDIDMRLRPSGRAGPVASHIDAFAQYQDHEAWTWEHMALTRARVISASPAFGVRLETIIKKILRRSRDRAMVASDVLEMRRAIAEEKGEGDIWNLKYVAGGLIDIEFIVQYLQLIHAAEKPDILNIDTLQMLDTAVKLGVLPSITADVLRSAMRLYHDLTQILRLCVETPFKPETAGKDLLRMLARAGDTPNFSVLEARVRDIQADVRAIFLEVLDT